jgi:hypothetical protein
MGELDIDFCIVMQEGAIMQLSHGPPCEWWRGTASGGQVGGVPSGSMVLLPKARAKRNFEPLPGDLTRVYA